MTFFPVVERELRVLARSRRLYWGRFVSAQIALALVAWFWFFSVSSASTANAAKQIFTGLSVLTFGYCLLFGSFLTADSISEEKREGTLGLLFLTDLKGYDVAFGKLAANSLQAIYNLLAIFPILSIPLLLGGLAGAEVFRMTLVLLDALIFSLTVGLLISTVSRHDRKAQAGAFAVVLGITGGLPAVLAFLQKKYGWPVPEWCFSISPGYAIYHAFDQAFLAKPQEFWLSLGLIHLLSWVAVLAAAFLVRRVWQDRPGETKVGWLGLIKRWKLGSAETRQHYREALLGTNAFYWLAARDRLKPYYVLCFLGGCALFWLLLWGYNPREMLEQEAFFLTACVLHVVLKVWLASEAGRQFYDDRKSSALELTLSTPLPVREILEGQFLGLFRQFGPAIGIVLLFDVLGMVAAARVRLGSESEWLLTWAAMVIIFVVDAATLATLGMWLGLTAKRYSRAVARSLFFVLVLPWIVFFALISYMALARITSLNSLSFVIGMYFIISLVTDLLLFLNASGNLTARFREVATQRFDSLQ